MVQLTVSQPSLNIFIRLNVNLYGLFILGINIKYMTFLFLYMILYGHINVPIISKRRY